MPKVSIIVPVYKAEKYLHRCIDSILSQTFTDWECILVDDGSPDRSGAICDEYAQKDARIRVIHKENGGVSSARNYGIQKVNSEWITFVDSDDYIQSDFLQAFVDCNPKKGCLYSCGIKYTYPHHAPVVMFEYPSISFPVTDFESLKKYRILANGCPVAKLFNVEILREHNLTFNESLSLNEDHIFVMQYLSHVDSIQLIYKILYNYWFDQFVTSLTKKRHRTEESLKAAKAISLSLSTLCKRLGCSSADILNPDDTNIFGPNQMKRAIQDTVFEKDPKNRLLECSVVLKDLSFNVTDEALIYKLLRKNQLPLCLALVYLDNALHTVRRFIVRIVKRMLKL